MCCEINFTKDCEKLRNEYNVNFKCRVLGTMLNKDHDERKLQQIFREYAAIETKLTAVSKLNGKCSRHSLLAQRNNI